MYTKGIWKVEPADHIGAVNVSFGEFKGGVKCWYHHGDTMTKEEAYSNAKLISAAPEMFEALKRVEAYLVANEDVLAPFPTRSELDSIRAAMFKTGLYQYK